MKKVGSVEIDPVAHFKALRHDLEQRAQSLTIDDLQAAIAQPRNRFSGFNPSIKLRSGVLRGDVYLKADPDDATLQAVSNWYNLFCQDGIVSAPSICLLLERAPTQVVSCRTKVSGMSMELVLRALEMLHNWKANIQEPHLIELLKLEQLPDELIKHSGIEKNDHQVLAQLLLTLRNLIPDSTAERVIEECPKFFDRIDHYAFSALFIAFLPIDPIFLVPKRLQVTWRVNEEGAPCYRLVCINSGKWGEVFYSPVMRTEKGHYNKILSTLLFMRKKLSFAIDPKFRAEFLSRSPLTWLLDWNQCLQLDGQRYQQLNLKQKQVPDESYPDRSFPFELTPDRLTIMLFTLESLYKAMQNSQDISLRECFRSARPANFVYYEQIIYPSLDLVNPAKGLTEGINNEYLHGPCFEDAFLRNRMVTLLEDSSHNRKLPINRNFHFLGYKKVIASHGLPSIEELCSEIKFPQLENISLLDLLKQCGHKRSIGDDAVFYSLNLAFERFIRKHQVFPALVRVLCLAPIAKILPLDMCNQIAFFAIRSLEKAKHITTMVKCYRNSETSQINRFSHFASMRPPHDTSQTNLSSLTL